MSGQTEIQRNLFSSGVRRLFFEIPTSPPISIQIRHQRTAAFEHLKQGLMDALLTGRRRVVV